MIPQVKKWIVRVLATETEKEELIPMIGPNKALIRIGFYMDYPQYWGRAFKISLAKMATKR